ncbi:lysozyme 3 [Drosophila pseudoobscura]|uniref:lysozyme n=1 Tax=Drosophila pseudoobscura pseudoobscura TaxID=46245 RepID=A0A6I8UUD7_DROPS|nr:lysozyme 3 [Drosophila pseudoobscura]
MLASLKLLTSLWLLLWLRLDSVPGHAVENKPVTEDCLECLCETMSGCNATAICVNGACGIFRITEGYWVEGGKLTLPDETPLSNRAFINCVNQPLCAANTIQSYMYKHGQDCNGDDHIDCLDFGALHKLGNLKCRGELPYIYAKVFNSCLKNKERQAQNADQTPNQVKIKDQSST